MWKAQFSNWKKQIIEEKMFTFNTFKYVNLKFICTKIKLEREGFFFFYFKEHMYNMDNTDIASG